MPASANRRRSNYRSHFPNYTFRCPACNHSIPSSRLERFTAVTRRQRSGQYGRYINVRQLRIFIEMVRREVDWDCAWVNVEVLERIIAYVSQMRDEDDMDVDAAPTPIQRLVAQLEDLGLDSRD
ncbi:hypothetical protein FRC07_014742 [Ceratobasidium sp. 392]|nr:hypothetical protein FRC07_014742 [Ceratobasidium sp. 392]